MTPASIPPLWGSPPQTSGDDRPVEQVEPAVVDASQSWRLRREIVDGDRFLHAQLGIVAGTEQDAMDMLLEIVTEQAPTLTTPATGYQITQDGTSLIVSPATRDRGMAYYQVHRFTAVRVLTTVPPVEKPTR